MYFIARSYFTWSYFSGLTAITLYWLKVFVSLDNYYKTLLAFESRFVFDKCAAVCERLVTLLFVGDIYCLEHSLSCLHIPLRLVKIFDSGFGKKLELRRVCARFVGAAYKGQLLLVLSPWLP